MDIKTATFTVSNSTYKKCPKPDRPEYAFIGRSNVGKSSLINMLVGNKSLAKTGSNPGKTQLINHFEINNSWYLVDLPGYGYARISKTSREKWSKMIQDYLLYRENLMNVFLLIDSRIPPQAIDLDFITFLGSNSFKGGGNFIDFFNHFFVSNLGIKILQSNIVRPFTRRFVYYIIHATFKILNIFRHFVDV